MHRCSLNSLNNLQIRFIESDNNIFSISSLTHKEFKVVLLVFAHRIKQPISKVRILNFQEFSGQSNCFLGKNYKYTNKTFSLVIICQKIHESSDRSLIIGCWVWWFRKGNFNKAFRVCMY